MADSDGETVLRITGLRKAFGGVFALDGADFIATGREVHALVGENGAGKSTFVKILAGVLAPDAGHIEIMGREIAARRRRKLRSAGIACVFQELSLIPDLTVAQNVWLGREHRTALGTISTRQLRRQTVDLFGELEISGLDPDTQVRSLPLAQRVLVEIARAISTEPRVLILDEATSALSPRETEWLLTMARKVANRGGVVLFISHRLRETRAVADRVTIFRNGRTVATHAIREVDDDQIVNEMLGRSPGRLYPERNGDVAGAAVLRVRDLEDGSRLQGVDFELREREILGVGGLQGQGQSELLLTLYGTHRRRHGAVEVFGVERRLRNPREALRAGLGLVLVPEDRQNQALLPPKTVRENASLGVLGLGEITRFGFLRTRKEVRLVRDLIQRLRIAAQDMNQPVESLSGGNQQKVVIGKMLLTRAGVLLLHDPTRGVDVGTKAEIFELMRDLAHSGKALLFYSSDTEELVNLCDRVIVLSDGKVAASLEGEKLTADNLLRASVGHPIAGAEGDK